MTRLTVNNQPVEYRLDPATPLLWALRDASNLTGTKYGCGTGECGACTVDVDGRAVRACLAPIGTVEGTYVTTVEGLSHERNHPLQLAFIAANLPQCGFCIPGMIMAAAVLLKKDRGDPARRAGAARRGDDHRRCPPGDRRRRCRAGGAGAGAAPRLSGSIERGEAFAMLTNQFSLRSTRRA
jgi:aerobic-type carbon monoxide dehydrogenase small subunit (CoxS/CutS family)